MKDLHARPRDPKAVDEALRKLAALRRDRSADEDDLPELPDFEDAPEATVVEFRRKAQ